MNDPRIGASIRALRRRKRWRQVDVAASAHVSQPLISTSTERRRVARHGAALDGAVPLRSDDLRAWMRRPVGLMSGILFVADSTGGDARNLGVTGVRVRRAARTPDSA